MKNNERDNNENDKNENDEKKLICALCEEEINENETIPTLDGKDACENCEHYAFENASQLTIFSENEPEKWLFTEDFGSLNTEDGDHLDHLPTPIKAEKYISTDGWRGYTDWEYEDGYKEIADGWITGYPDRYTSHKIFILDLLEKFHDQTLNPPFPIYVITGTTSNVFSTVSSIVIKEEHEEELAKWLEENGAEVKDIQNSLN